MRTRLDAQLTVLYEHCTVALHDRQGERIDCLGGQLWITQDGDQRDIVLRAGESFELDRPGLALVSALAVSRFVLRRPGAPRLAELAAADIRSVRAASDRRAPASQSAARAA